MPPKQVSISSKMDDETTSDFDLSPIVAHNAGYEECPSVFLSKAEQCREVQPQPISKRRGKKRSSKACGSCRSRKVRCNLVAHGAPCSNCRHDEIDCVLPLSRRQMAAQERTLQNNRPLGAQDSSYDSAMGEFSQNHPVAKMSCSQEAGPTTTLSSEGKDTSHCPLSEVLPTNSVSQCHTPSAQNSTSSSSRKWAGSKHQICEPLATAPPLNNMSINILEPGIPTLPQVFAPFPSHIDTSDLSYLHRRDALTLPSERLQVALLKSYTEFVHPSMPILDLEDFIGRVKCGGQSGSELGKLEFLLFQAVMFAGVEFVGLRILREEGYGGRDSARRALWARVRLLYDFDITADRHTLIQSLLLASLYNLPSHNFKDHKNASHFLNLAISLSFALGINRNITSPLTQSPSYLRRRRMERRMWWCAFARDRLLAMENFESGKTNKGTMIRKLDCEIEMLKLEDFEIDSGEDYEDDYDGDDLETTRFRARKDAKALIEKVRICWWSTDDWSPVTRCSETKGGNATASSLLFQNHQLKNYYNDYNHHHQYQDQHQQQQQSSQHYSRGSLIPDASSSPPHLSLIYPHSATYKLGISPQSHQHQPIMDHTDFPDLTASLPSLESSSCATSPYHDPFPTNIEGADHDEVMEEEEAAAVDKPRPKFDGGHGDGDEDTLPVEIEGQYDDYFEYFKVDLGDCDEGIGRELGKEKLGRRDASIWV